MTNVQAQNEYNYFRYIGQPLTEALYANNPFHNNIYVNNKKQLFYTDYLGYTNSFRCSSLDNIFIGKITLDKYLAHYSAIELRNLGLQLPLNFESNHKRELIASYLLNSSLCWIYSTNSKKEDKMFFVTKSAAIFTKTSKYFAPTEVKKKISKYANQLTTTYQELSSGQFNVVTFTNDKDGFRIGTAKINIMDTKNVYLNTMYSIDILLGFILRYLRQHTVLLSYNENGSLKTILTSLRETDISKWLGTRNKEKITEVIDGAQNLFLFGDLILPLLNEKECKFININLISIRSIKNC